MQEEKYKKISKKVKQKADFKEKFAFAITIKNFIHLIFS